MLEKKTTFVCTFSNKKEKWKKLIIDIQEVYMTKHTQKIE